MKKNTRLGKPAILHPVEKVKPVEEIVNPAFTNNTPLNEIWMDKYDVLTQMHISARTLQNWRTKRTLPFSKICGKIYYKRNDIVQLLDKTRELSL